MVTSVADISAKRRAYGDERGRQGNEVHSTSSEWGKAIGDRDSDVEQSQRTPSLHYTGYIVQTVCQLSVGRALPCWGLSGWTGAQPPRVREVTTPRTVVYRREQMI